jgi:hypothetical protein
MSDDASRTFHENRGMALLLGAKLFGVISVINSGTENRSGLKAWVAFAWEDFVTLVDETSVNEFYLVPITVVRLIGLNDLMGD